MTLRDLKKLKVGDRVRLYGDKREPAESVGRVHAIDERAVEVHWPDGTSTLIWFVHVEEGRDTRHATLVRVTQPERAVV